MLISARTAEQLEVVAEQVRATGRRCLVVPADLSDLDAVAGLAQTAYDEFGRLDTVVNNVGGTFPKEFLKTSPRFLNEAFSFNVTTAHALTRAAVPLMLQDDDGKQKSVVTISSMMGRTADRGFVAYGTAKAALAHWTKMAAQDLVAAHPGQRHLRRLDPDQRAGVRRRPARADGPARGQDAARAGSASPRTSPPACSTCRRRPGSTSPAS